MNCDDFNQWLQDQLDERQNVVYSRDAKKHLNECHVCRDQLNAWQQIASILPVHSEIEPIDLYLPERRQRRWMTWAAVASAAVLCVILLKVRTQDPTIDSSSEVVFALYPNVLYPNDSTPAPESTDRSTLATGDAVIAPSRWWNNAQQRDWINRTIDNSKPTVASMRDGVAPLGRSIVLAVTLLTNLGGDQTS